MSAFSWLGPLREPVRHAALSLLRQILATDDGREILSDDLSGLTVLGSLDGPLPPPPGDYPELPSETEWTATKCPVFITGRFRSGSTLVWNLFRHVPSCRSYYEPLNERRWFDSAHRGTRVDRTHLGVEEYWREYNGLDDIGRFYREDWIRRRLYMRENDVDPHLTAYIQALIDAAPQRAVLQFNRVDFRLPWLKRQFPTARLLHIYRQPRDQWMSSLLKDVFPPHGTIDAFGDHDWFYLLAWARDLTPHFPFLDSRTANHPYRVFYYLWRLSYAFGRRYSDASVCFEELCALPAVEIPRLMDAAMVASSEYDLGVLTSLILPTATGRWKTYADDSWFREHELACEVELQRFFGMPVKASQSIQPRTR